MTFLEWVDQFGIQNKNEEAIYLYNIFLEMKTIEEPICSTVFDLCDIYIKKEIDGIPAFYANDINDLFNSLFTVNNPDLSVLVGLLAKISTADFTEIYNSIMRPPNIS